jgi:hypothetical protein
LETCLKKSIDRVKGHAYSVNKHLNKLSAQNKKTTFPLKITA